MKRSATPLYAYATVVVVAGLSILVVDLSGGLDSDVFRSSHLWLLFAAIVAGEFVSITVPHRQETIAVTVGDPFTLSLLFTFGLGPALIAKTLASLLDDIRRRQTWWKALFNVGQFAISLAVGSWVVDSLGYHGTEPQSMTPQDILATLTGAAVYFGFNMAIVTTAIAISVGESPLVAFGDNFKTRVIQQGALLGFTPVVAAAIHDSAAFFPLLLIPIVVVYYSGLLTQRHVTLAQQLTELYETTRITNARISTREAVHQLLERVCTMFNASRASITLFAQEDDQHALRNTLDVDKGAFSYMEPGTPDPTQGIWARAAAENRAILLAKSIKNPQLRAHYDSLGVKDLMVAPMHSENRVIGVLEVYNRRGDSQTFTSEDLRLFETLANHASISLENARLINELEESLEHLTEMNQLKDDFVASVSHELRTPLTSIQGYVKTLLRPDAKFEPEQQRQFLETVDRQSNRLYRLIEDLLAVSRIESNTDATMKTIVSLKQVIEEVIDEVRGRTKDSDVELDFDGELLVETDGGKVHQIFSNLVDNALKYGGKDSPVLVQGRKDGEGAVVSVIDKGHGVPEDLQDRIFDRFYQVDQSATRVVGGAGLGLYICRRLAEAIGGRVWLERTGPEGSTFSVWIPTSTPGATVQTVGNESQQSTHAEWKM